MKKIALLVFVIVIAVAPAFADTLIVPFFRDGFSGGAQEGFISIANASVTDTVVSIVYVAANNPGVFQATATFALAAGSSTGWQPVVVGGPSEGGGSTVADMTVHTNGAQVAAGTAIISAAVAIRGRYLERNSVTGETAMYVLTQ